MKKQKIKSRQKKIDDHSGAEKNTVSAIFKKGVRLEKASKLEEALENYNFVLELQTDFLDALYHRAAILQKLNRHSAVIQDCERLINLQQIDISVLSIYSKSLRALHRFEAALGYANQALRLDPHNDVLLFNQANILLDLKYYHSAINSYHLALKIVPNDLETLSNRALALRALGRNEEALASYNQALLIDSNNSEVLLNRSGVLYDLLRYQEVIRDLCASIKSNQRNIQSYVNLALCYLLLGDFVEGFKIYEWREDLPEVVNLWPKFPGKRWFGQCDIRGKTILVHIEQGMGDIIQFCRYIFILKERGAHILFLVPTVLVSLLQDLPVDQLVTSTENLSEFDYYIPIMSLAFALGTNLNNIPNTIPYLQSKPVLVNKWKEKLNFPNKIKIGITWSGSATFKGDVHRSIPLHQFYKLQSPDIIFVCLQKEIRLKDQYALAQRGDIIFVGDDLTDFSDTAAIIESMDLIISVDTAIAHLAGAMGKPVWILLPYNPDWRWLLEREETPWYPTARLFRQNNVNDWNSVLDKVYQELLQHFSLIDKRPDFVKTMAPIGVVYQYAYQLKTQGKFKEAMTYYNHILERVPDYVNALIDVGNLLIEEKRFDAALVCYNDALSYQPEEVINLLPSYTRVLDILGRKSDIFFYYQKALELAPVNAALIYNYANVLCAAKQYQLALVQYELALRIDKDDVATLNNYALALENVNQYEFALKNYQRALALVPNHSGILLNCVNVLQTMQRHDEVIDICDQLLRMNPDNTGAHLFKSISLLLKGEFLLGFQGLEWRWMRSNIPKVFHTQSHHKKWLGDFSLLGKVIIVPLEYGIGFGDIIHFYRYIPLLTQRADKVITVAPVQLHVLLKTILASHQIITPEQEVPYFDCYCPIQSLPWAFKTDLNTIPNTVPYLFSDSNISTQWGKKLLKARSLKIGIAWSGKREDKNDRHRSIPTALLSSLFALDVDFYCLQIEIDSTDKENALEHKNVHFYESELTHFAQTAGLIEQMDIVITVDTVIAHLAGALGKVVWVLLSANPDWRWLMQGNDSLWYPTARLFRQEILGEWGGVISRVNLELLKKLDRS